MLPAISKFPLPVIWDETSTLPTTSKVALGVPWFIPTLRVYPLPPPTFKTILPSWPSNICQSLSVALAWSFWFAPNSINLRLYTLPLEPPPSWNPYIASDTRMLPSISKS